MHIFRQVRQRIAAGALVRAWEEAAGGEWPLDLLLAAARLECACADEESGEEGERMTEGGQARLGLSLQAAAWYMGWEARPGGATLKRVGGRLPTASKILTVGALEGIRYYALEPRGYAQAAQQWLQRRQGRGEVQPEVWVVGLRSMGSVLAPVVAGYLRRAGCRVRCQTVRPCGAPGRRQLRLHPRLAGQWAAWRGQWLIVDEGPGLSGSSFSGAVQALEELGVGWKRVALLAGWAPEAEQAARLSQGYAAQHWQDWEVYAAAPLAAPDGLRGQEISGGGWRQALGRQRGQPVWPVHEHRKILLAGGRELAKFAGLGAWGERTRARALRLAEAGWAPPLGAEAGAGRAGWIVYRRLRTRPLPARPGAQWCDWVGRYLAFVAAEFGLGGWQPPSAALVEMLEINHERLGLPGAVPEPAAGPLIAVDGRMQAVEWGCTGRAFVKFDGTDHHDDPFFPGPCDIAWDLAAVAVEWDGAHEEAVVRAYCRASGERRAALEPRLHWHRLAYAVYRSAYCRFAAGQVEGSDAAGFARQARRYQRCAAAALRGQAQAATWDRRC